MSSNKNSESDLIRRLFAPLAEHYPGALDLKDDAALIENRPGHDIVMTTDCLIEDVHFRLDDPPEAVAARSLRSNLSDLAAMGAEPHIYSMAISIPNHVDVPWLERFSAQLSKDQQTYDIHLAGGDTVATPGPLSISITAIGHVPGGTALQRRGAKPGDGIFVTGTIGDAALGLRILQENLELPDNEDREYLVKRFHFPSARIHEGFAIRARATACADISDGLVRDLSNILTVSGCRAVVEWGSIPLSRATLNALETTPSLADLVLSGGDDYELVFTGPDDLAKEFPRIGLVENADETKTSVEVWKDGQELTVLGVGGYEHKW